MSHVRRDALLFAMLGAMSCEEDDVVVEETVKSYRIMTHDTFEVPLATCRTSRTSPAAGSPQTAPPRGCHPRGVQ